MATAISISDDLISKISEAARKAGFATTDDFVERAIQEKLAALEEQGTIFAITDKVRTGLEAKGISEADTLNDFERFRQRLS